MKLTKLLTLGFIAGSIFCFTGCTQKEYTNDDIVNILATTSEIQKYKENILLNYAVDDTAITASGEISHDIKNKISSGKIRVSYNDNIFDISLFEKDGQTYFLDKNNNIYYADISLQKISNGLNKNADKESINFIKIASDEDENLSSYRLNLLLDKEFNSEISKIGQIFFNKNEIKNQDELAVLKSINIEDGYNYKTEINLKQILESNLVDDTSVIGVATLVSKIIDTKENIQINYNIDNAIELTDFTNILNTYIEEEQE